MLCFSFKVYRKVIFAGYAFAAGPHPTHAEETDGECATDNMAGITEKDSC